MNWSDRIAALVSLASAVMFFAGAYLIIVWFKKRKSKVEELQYLYLQARQAYNGMKQEAEREAELADYLQNALYGARRALERGDTRSARRVIEPALSKYYTQEQMVKRIVTTAAYVGITVYLASFVKRLVIRSAQVGFAAGQRHGRAEEMQALASAISLTTELERVQMEVEGPPFTAREYVHIMIDALRPRWESLGITTELS